MARMMKQQGPILADAYAKWPLPPLLRALRAHALGKRHIYVRFGLGDRHDALFTTAQLAAGRDPHVEVFTPERAGHVDSAHDVEHAIRLAHELGHHESWLREDTTKAFEALMASDPRALHERPEAIAPALQVEARAEEERAWRYGRAILAAALPKFTAWEAYDAQAAAGAARLGA